MPARSEAYLVLAALASGACSPDAASREPLTAALPARAEAPIPLDTLLGRLRTAAPELRVEAARALAQPGPQAEQKVRALRGALSDPDRTVGQVAAWSLGMIGAASVPALVSALSDPRGFVRARAVYGLGTAYGHGTAGQQTATTRLAIHSATYDPDASVRRTAQWALKQALPRASPGGMGPALGSIADLRAGLAASEPEERLDAIRRFRSYAASPEESARLLLRGLGDTDSEVRQAAIDALLGLGSPARAALTAALSDSNPVVRREASVALVRLGMLR